MEEAQAPALQVGQAAMGIEQLAAAALKHQGHGIDAEIAAGQVVLQHARANTGVFAGFGVGLAAGRG